MAEGNSSNIPSMGDIPGANPKIAARLDVLAKRRLDRLNSQTTEFQRAITDIGAEWKKALINLLSKPESLMANAGQVQDLMYLQGEVLGQLKKLGYTDLCKEFINEFDAQKQQALATVQALNVDTTRLGPFDESALQNLKNLNLGWLDNLGQHASGEIARGIIMSTVAGASRADLIENVKLSVDAKLVNYACTYADTALATYDREAHWQMCEAAGVEKFVYIGPKDLRKRPFCLKLLGKVFTKAQIATMNNGTRLMPVSKFGGGWNCRDCWSVAPWEPEPDKLAQKAAQAPAVGPALESMPPPLLVAPTLEEAKAQLEGAKTGKSRAFQDTAYWRKARGR